MTGERPVLRLHNTLTRKKQVFEPIDPSNVRMYVCGPTVYDFAHIGNARPIIVFDVLYRLLRHIYGPEHVTYVRNITDVDDKINRRAAEEGVPIAEITARTIDQFHKDIAALGVLEPDVEPRATEHIEEMKAMIEQLVEKGCAYVAEDHVLFDVTRSPRYGQLSHRSLDEMIAGARVDVAPFKRNPQDFVLWKPSKEGEPAWPSPCGIAAEGRPGWHIECSAMSDKWLWAQARDSLSDAGRAHPHVFDIHGGGADLVFPHHENEIAQSCCAHGTEEMARFWLHNGYLQVEGEKMSKSLGNFITIHALLQDWPGEVLRFNMLRTHYRQPLDWTRSGLQQSRETLERWLDQIGDVDGREEGSADPAVVEALSDDLNSPKAIAELHRLSREGAREALAASLRFLGFTGETLRARKQAAYASLKADEDRIRALITERTEARKARNWAEADRIRDELAAMGIVLKDARDPETGELKTTWEIAR